MARSREELEQKKARLSAKQRQQLEQALRGKATLQEPSELPASFSPDATFPLSFAQERLWFLHQLHPQLNAYHISVQLRLLGDVRLELLCQSFDEVIKRHDVLRMFIENQDGKPVARICPNLSVPAPLHDLSHAPPHAQEQEVRVQALTLMQEPFDLGKAQLLRLRLLRLCPQEHVLLLVVHHMVADAWSLDRISQEVAACYQALQQGQKPRLPFLRLQYADFANWQRQQLAADRLQPMLRYWTNRLAGAPSSSGLILDKPRGPLQSFRGARTRFVVDPDLVSALLEVSQGQQATLFMTLLAGWMALLYRTTRQKTQVVGSPVANRGRMEFEPLVGLFLNSLPFRCDMSDELRFEDLLALTRETVVEGLEHQELPFEKLVESLSRPRDLSANPVFQVMFALQQAPQDALALPGLKVLPLSFDGQTSMLDLFLSLTERPGELEGFVEYNTDLFEARTIDGMIRHYLNLLASAVRQPTLRISELKLCDQEEEQLLLHGFNQTENPASLAQEGQCLHHLFEAQAARLPLAQAAACADDFLTYAQLNDQADVIAQRLLHLGMKPGSIVGLCMDRSLEMLVGILGILKSGAAYLPLDATLPDDRLALMLEETGCRHVLCGKGQQQKLAKYAVAAMPLIDLVRERQGSPGANKKGSFSPADLAYVMYTSGSTGKPKGVQIEHHSVVNAIRAISRRIGFVPGDSWLAVTSLGFDISVLELLFPLCCGGLVRIAQEHQVRDGFALSRQLADTPVTFMQATPTSWSMLLNAGWQGDGRMTILCGGEKLLPSLAQALSDRCRILWNMYGPTETTIWSTMQQVKKGDLVIPIGRPIDNTQVYVQDASMRLAPIGVPGELYIGGEGVSRGYLGREELNQNSFVANPFDKQKGSRLYRTGDIARFRAGGVLEFLGRADDQVKLSGYRIEPGEVESQLRSHPAVRESAVVVEKSGEDLARLVAYVAPQNPGRPFISDPNDLEHSLQLRSWQRIWQDTYQQLQSPEGQSWATPGWVDSYNGRRIDQPQMQEWIEASCQRILATHPKDVLEIGVGNGLLLLALAPHCARYWGTDSSSNALQVLSGQLARQHLPSVELYCRDALDLAGIDAHRFDTIVLNSVVQYFPSATYLFEVLRRAWALVKPNGKLFVGDVRNHRLLDVFHAEVQLHKSQPTLLVSSLRRLIQGRIRREAELALDPEFFAGLQEHLPGMDRVEIQLRRGSHCNEMTKYRYDAVLHAGDEAPSMGGQSLDWDKEQLDLHRLRQTLARHKQSSLQVRNIGNRRLAPAVRAMKLLEQAKGNETVAELRQQLSAWSPGDGYVDPEMLWQLAEEEGFQAGVCFAVEGDRDRIDVIFRSSSEPLAAGRAKSRACSNPSQEFLQKANQPLRAVRDNALVSDLRSYLKGRLPHYMVPVIFVVVDELPRTSGGKVDRQALPPPDMERLALANTYVPPRNGMEQKLSDIWAHVLGVERVGIHDNFFEFGGASLSSIRVVAEARKASMRLSPEMMFAYPTIAQLSEQISRMGPEPHEIGTPAHMDRAADATALGIGAAGTEKKRNATSVIESLGVYLPGKRWSTAQVLLGCKKPLDFPLQQSTGIESRPVVDDNEFSFELAKRAVEKCFQGSMRRPSDIDLLICCSISRCDGPGLRLTFEPCTAVRLAAACGMDHALCFDVSNACAGTFTALNLADAFLRTKASRCALIVSGEYITHLTRTAQQEIDGPLDRRIPCLTLGDSGLALILEPSPDGHSGFVAIDMYTMSKYSDCCVARPTSEPHGGAVMFTDSVALSAAGLPQAAQHSVDLLNRYGWPVEKLKHLIMHQSSRTTILGSMSEINRMFDREICTSQNTIDNMAQRGNTATTTHFVALQDAIQCGRIRSGDPVVFSVTGSGLTIGTALYRLDDLPDRLRQGKPVPPSQSQQKELTPLESIEQPIGIQISSVGLLSPAGKVNAATLPMTRAAAEDCIQRWGGDRREIDLLLFCGVYRTEFVCEPAIATLIASDLGLNPEAAWNSRTKTFALDVFNGAVGFVNACQIACRMIENEKFRRVLIVAAEVENNDLSQGEPLLGIAQTASAVLVERTSNDAKGFGTFCFEQVLQDLDRFGSYTVQAGGRTRLQIERASELEHGLVEMIARAATALLAKARLSWEDIRMVIPPQISSSFIEQLATRLPVPKQKMVDVSQGNGDLFTSSIPHGLRKALDQGLVKPGDIGLLISAGSGMQVGCVLYYF